MENASAAFLVAVRRSMRDVRRAPGHGRVDPATLTAAERLQYESWRRRTDADAAVLALREEGLAVKEIVRRTERSRKLVRDLVRGGRGDPFRPRASSLEPWLDRLGAEWAGGCRNGAELWRRLRAGGFAGSLRVVTEWAARRRRDEAATTSPVASFANGIAADKAAVSAAISLPWSKGQTGGQICKLKCVKRRMYGQGKLDLLRARLTPAH